MSNTTSFGYPIPTVRKVSALRQRMIDDMTVRNFAPNTQVSYLHQVSLFARHFDLFTLIALTVWLPSHLVINYIDFFATSKDAADAGARGFRVGLMVEGAFGPLVVAATLAALARITRGEPASYAQAMRHGFATWPRLFIAGSSRARSSWRG